MQLNTSNYNTLGRVGSHYQRPEYRPPQEPAVNDGRSGGLLEKGDRSTLSTKNTDVASRNAPLTVPTGRLNLEAARNMTLATSDLIIQLPPLATSRTPHNDLPTSLMSPVYV